MKTIRLGQPIPHGTIEAFNLPNGDVLCIEGTADYDALPDEQKAIHAASLEPNPDAALLAQFDAEQQAKQAAEFDAYKARSGEPSYKAAAVKIAAEKLGLLATIEAAIMALVEKASDKALYVWWSETDAISRGDAQWIAIEPAVSWGKSSADDLFALAAQV